MKLSCSRESLLNHINIVSKAVSNRTSLPILECILLTTNENTLYLTATDLELGIKSNLADAQITESGIIALEAKIFSEIIRKMDGEIVCLETKENYTIMISCGFSRYQIMGQSGEEFPELPEIEKLDEYIIGQNQLKNMIRQTIFSIAQDDSKPILTGELIEVQKNKLNLVSVDGYRISYRQAVLHQEQGELNAVVPGKTLNEISKILSAESDDTLSISFTDKHVLFDLGASIVISRLLEGDFIKYAQSFNEDYKTKMVTDRTELISCLERASLISRDSRKTPVKLEISTALLRITSNTEIGTANEEMEIEMDGESLIIAFNPKYLIDALKAIEDEKIAMHFTTSLSPCIIKPLDGADYQYLILPLRM